MCLLYRSSRLEEKPAASPVHQLAGFGSLKAFSNGNLHIELKRQDLLDKVNEQIAEFYAVGAFPDTRSA